MQSNKGSPAGCLGREKHFDTSGKSPAYFQHCATFCPSWTLPSRLLSASAAKILVPVGAFPYAINRGWLSKRVQDADIAPSATAPYLFYNYCSSQNPVARWSPTCRRAAPHDGAIRGPSPPFPDFAVGPRLRAIRSLHPGNTIDITIEYASQTILPSPDLSPTESARTSRSSRRNSPMSERSFMAAVSVRRHGRGGNPGCQLLGASRATPPLDRERDESTPTRRRCKNGLHHCMVPLIYINLPRGESRNLASGA